MNNHTYFGFSRTQSKINFLNSPIFSRRLVVYIKRSPSNDESVLMCPVNSNFCLAYCFLFRLKINHYKCVLMSRWYQEEAVEVFANDFHIEFIRRKRPPQNLLLQCALKMHPLKKFSFDLPQKFNSPQLSLSSYNIKV